MLNPLNDKHLLISDLFFNFISHVGQASRNNVSYQAGKFAKALQDCGYEITAEDLRKDFFNRL